jgi:hypothetical protein
MVYNHTDQLWVILLELCQETSDDLKLAESPFNGHFNNAFIEPDQALFIFEREPWTMINK